MLNGDMLETAAFFERSPGALPLYEAFAEKVCAAFPDVNIKIQKTQITFTARYGFAFVSLPRSKKIGPAGSVVISLGLPREVRSPRIFAAVEPYPGRWTHHLLLQSPEEIDPELMMWVKEAYDFAQIK